MTLRKVSSSHLPGAKLKAFRQSRGRGFFTDVFIYSQCHESVPAHRAVLSSYSPWLAGLFESFECACRNENCGQHETRVVYMIIPEVDIAQLDRLMDFLYLGCMTIRSKEDYRQMREVAQLLGIHKFPHLPEDAFPSEDEAIIELIDLEQEDEEDDHENREDVEEEEEEEEEDEESIAEELYDPKDESLEDSDQPPSVTESENEDRMDQASDPCSSPISSWASENPLLSQDPLSQPDNSELDSYLLNEPENDPDFSEPSVVCVHCYQVFSEPTDLIDHLSKDHSEPVPEVEMTNQDDQPSDVSTNLPEVQNESTFARIRILPVDNLKNSEPERDQEMVEKNTKPHLIKPSDPSEQDLKTREPFSPCKTFQESESPKDETIGKPIVSPKEIILETPESLECVTSVPSNLTNPTTEVTKKTLEPSEDVGEHDQSCNIHQQVESEIVSCEISVLKSSAELASAQISKDEHVLRDESVKETVVGSNIELKYAIVSKGDQVLQDESAKEIPNQSNYGTFSVQCGDGYAREETATSNPNHQVEDGEDGPQILLLQSGTSEQIQTFVEDTSSNPMIKLDIIDGSTEEEIQIQPSNEKTEVINPELKFGTPEKVQIQPFQEKSEVSEPEVKSEPPAEEEQMMPLKQEIIPEMSSSQWDLKEVKKNRESGSLAKRRRSRKRTYIPRKSKAKNEEAPPKIDKTSHEPKSDAVSTDGVSELDFSDVDSSSTPRSNRYSRFKSGSEEQECAPILEKPASRGRGRSRASRNSRESSTKKPSFGLDQQPLNFLDKARDV